MFTFAENAIGLIPVFAFTMASEKLGRRLYMMIAAWNMFELGVIVSLSFCIVRVFVSTLLHPTYHFSLDYVLS